MFCVGGQILLHGKISGAGVHGLADFGAGFSNYCIMADLVIRLALRRSDQ